MTEKWIKSTKSGPYTDNCVEVAFTQQSGGNKPGDVIRVRDSKDPAGPVLTFTQDEWTAFVAGAKGGEFDL